MNAKEVIQSRRSCRKFDSRPVDRETIRQIVELAKCAPSWKNTQSVRYLVVDSKELKDRLAEQYVLGFTPNTKTLQRCAAMVVVTGKAGLSGTDAPGGQFYTDDGAKWEYFDAGIAVQTFCLAAREYELGTCIIGIYDHEGLKKELELPEDETVTCLIALGYPDQWPAERPRLSVDELLSFR